MANRVLFLIACHLVAALSSPPPGGKKPIQPGDVNVVKVANFAAGQLNLASNSEYALVMTSVVEGTQQVTSGLKYDLKIKVCVTTNCRNEGKSVSLDDCRPDMATARYFQVQVASQPWKTPSYTFLGSAEAELGEQEGQFQKYIIEYSKNYRNDANEYEKRLAIFQGNLQEIATLEEHEEGTATYGTNEFADLSREEFTSGHTMPNGWPETETTNMIMASRLSLQDVPSSFDWREKDVVTPIKNQGSCGSCWAFSTTGNIEGQWAIHHGKLISLSEQELVDCDKVDKGCEGGLPSTAYTQIMKLGGLETEADYPYQAANMKCRFDSSKVAININGSLTISSDEDQMAAWLAAHGPISIGINAAAMQFYIGGVADPWSILCNPKHLDHGVLIVGYGEERDRPFWIIKNSWGESWGEKGYYRIIRGKGKCGLNSMPTSATVA